MKKFIEILCCPITRKPLKEMNRKVLAELNLSVDKGRLFHLSGSPVLRELDAALVTGGGEYAYAVVDGIIILRADLAIVLKGKKASEGMVLNKEKKIVQDFYDNLGWTKSSEETFVDASKFEDLRTVSKEYIHDCHMRVKAHISQKGKYLMDVASGPIQYDDYLSYSEDFQYRICVDISVGALRHARERLGEKGIYLLADITNLPIKDSAIDAVVSLHTIYHVPAGEQKTAFFEIERVLAQGASAVVVYSWGGHSRLMIGAFFPAWLFVRLLSLLKGGGGEKEIKEGGLYFHAHSYDWFRRDVASKIETQVFPWRSVNITFMKAYIHSWLFGKTVLSFIYSLEEKYPVFFGRNGAYPLIVIKKTSSGKK